MKKKIIYIITRSDIGGAQNHLLSLIQFFHKKYELVLISGTDGALVNKAQELGVVVHVLEPIDSFRCFSAIFRLTQILRTESPDLVHTHSSLASLYGRLAAKFFGAKVLYTVHGWHFANLENKFRANLQIVFERFYKPLTDCWVVVSNFDLKLGLSHNLFRQNNVECVENGISDKVLQDINKSTKKIKVVFVGRVSEQKNPASAISVLEKCSTDTDLTMYLAGSDIADLERRIQINSLTDRCDIILNNTNPSEHFYKYDVMIVTSRYEGMPLSVLEALRAGLPVISTNVCGMSELVKPQNGYLVELGDEIQMAKHIDYLNKNRMDLSAKSKGARRMFEESFVDSIMFKKVASIYEKLLS